MCLLIKNQKGSIRDKMYCLQLLVKDVSASEGIDDSVVCADLDTTIVVYVVIFEFEITLLPAVCESEKETKLKLNCSPV